MNIIQIMLLAILLLILWPLIKWLIILVLVLILLVYFWIIYIRKKAEKQFKNYEEINKDFMNHNTFNEYEYHNTSDDIIDVEFRERDK